MNISNQYSRVVVSNRVYSIRNLQESLYGVANELRNSFKLGPRDISFHLYGQEKGNVMLFEWDRDPDNLDVRKPSYKNGGVVEIFFVVQEDMLPPGKPPEFLYQGESDDPADAWKRGQGTTPDRGRTPGAKNIPLNRVKGYAEALFKQAGLKIVDFFSSAKHIFEWTLSAVVED